jgi:hypothetical protein
MSDLPMTVPDGCDDLKYAELMIGLPPEWPMDQKAWSDESHYWPIRWLKLLARLPHEYKTWLGFGHTIPNGDPPEPFADDVDFCCALVVPPVAVPEEFRELVINEEKTIHFYAFVPLYREETIFKLKKGADPLLDRFDAKGVNEIFNPNRANVCKKKFGLF